MIKKLVLYLLLSAFVLGNIITFLVPTPVAAQYSSTQLTEDKWDDVELIAAFINWCVPEISNDVSYFEAERGEIFGESNDHKVNISPFIGQGGSVDGDSQRECQNLSIGVMRNLYGSIESFHDNFYTIDGLKEKYCGPSADGGDGCSSYSGGSNDVDESIIQTELRQKAEEEGFYANIGGELKPKKSMWLEYRLLRPLFVNNCFKNSGSSSKKVSIQGEDYYYRGESTDPINVGILIDGGNGQWNCGEMADNVNTDRWAFVALTQDEYIAQENENIQNEDAAQKYEEIKAIIDAGDPNAFASCVLPTVAKYIDSEAFAGASGEDINNYILLWMASWSAGTANGDVPWTDAEGEAMIACLTEEDKFGSELADVLEREPEITDPSEIPDITASPEDEAPEDVDNCKGGGGISAFLGFILCPIVHLVIETVEWVQDSLIIPYLAVNPLDQESTNPVFLLWQIVRNVAYVFLILSFMYLIFAETTSIGGEAYQLKRMAPRLVMVTIGISLSYYIVGLAIDFFNVLGVGIGGITKYALDQAGATSLYTVNASAQNFALAGFLGSVGVAALGVALLSGTISAGAIGIAVIAGIFVLFAVAITLVLRQALIMILVILTPIAFVAVLLPNTEKFFKMWWSYLSKALMMYPLIMLLFAGGKLLSALLQSPANPIGGGGGVGADALTDLLAFMAHIAPLVLVPFTFKFGGGMLASIYGAMRGGAGKARNVMMGDPHNPNSIRGQRAAVGQRWTRRIGGASKSMRMSDKLPARALRKVGGGKAAGLFERATRMDERLAHAEEESEKRANAYLNQVDDQFVKQLALGPEAIKAEHIEGTTGEDGTLTAGGQRAAAFNYKPSEDLEPNAQRLRKDMAVRKGAMKRLGAHDGANTVRVQQVRQALQRDVAEGRLQEHQADELWTEFAKAGKSQNVSLDTMKGANGEKSRAWAGHFDDVRSNRATLEAQLGKMYGKTDNERMADGDWAMMTIMAKDDDFYAAHADELVKMEQKADSVIHRRVAEPDVEVPEGSTSAQARGYGLNQDKVEHMNEFIEAMRARRGGAPTPPIETPPTSST